jgi:4-amino-4-deoxy-L-arabinose transferase-like glycosyltransferase
VDIPVRKRWLDLGNGTAPTIAVFLIALVVRLLGIATRPIWYDEAFAVLFSEKGLKAMLAGTLTVDPSGAAADIHPLAYYTLLGGWMKIFGESLVSVRMLSILLGMGIVILAYFLMHSMFPGGRLGVVAALGVALAPFLVHYSQEVRMYVLLALSLTGATCAMWLGLHSSRLRWWVLFAFCAALAQYSQNLAVFYLVPLALTPVFMRRWDKVKMTFLAGVGAVVLYLPWLIQLPAQLIKIQNSYWVDRPTLGAIFSTLLAFVTNLPVDARWLPLALALSLLVFTLAAYQTILALHHKLPGGRRGLWLAYLALTPPALAFFFSQWRPVYVERAFLPSAVMFWLWLAWALMATKLPRLLQVFCLAFLMVGIAFGLVTHLTYAGFPYSPYKALDASLESRLQLGDLILHSNKLSLLPAIYFDRGLKQEFLADQPASGSDTLAPATQQVLGIIESASLETATAGNRRVWFIIFQKELDESTSSGLSGDPHLAWLDGNFQLENMETWGPLQVYIYHR